MSGQRFNSGRVSAWGIGNRTLPGVQPRLTNTTAFSGIPGVGSDQSAISTWAPSVGNRAAVAPFAVLGEQITITDAELRVTTQAVSASSARIAIYNVNDKWEPTSLVSDLGTVSIASTGRKEINNLSVILRPGYYAVWVVVELAVSIELKGGTAIWWSAYQTAVNNPARTIRESFTQTYGVAPDPHPAISDGTQNVGSGGVAIPVSFKWAVS